MNANELYICSHFNMSIKISCSQLSSAFEKASIDDSRKSKSTQTSNSEKGLNSTLNIIA